MARIGFAEIYITPDPEGQEGENQCDLRRAK
jgi:hypothetical protein